MKPQKVRTSKTLRPEEVETVVQHTIRKIKENPRWALCIVAVIFILGVLFWGYDKYSKSQDEQAAYAYYLIVKSLSEHGKAQEGWERAIVDFLNRYDGHPMAVLARLDLVRLDVEHRNWERAIKESESTIQKLPSSHPLKVFFLRYLAIAYTERNFLDRALLSWDELAKISPEEWKREIYWRRGLILELKGKMDEARASWEEALKAKGIFPTDDLIREHINKKTRSTSAPSSGS
ncbi:MAG: tetratricopeptide repeat protein [Syntrophobacterales bacterium]|nr:tetratricopeptide repeat protein [Syntrophobacterales bacterium]